MAYAEPAAPMGEMNTTPLIDVMLVLLIMFIITIPVATHSVDIDLPTDGPPPLQTLQDKNRITVTPQDELLWNGEPTTEAQLFAILGVVSGMRPEPETQVAPSAGASYDRTAKLMHLVGQSGATKVGIIGNEQFRSFGKAGD